MVNIWKLKLYNIWIYGIITINMRLIDSVPSEPAVKVPRIITAGGEARSGKGTSMADLKDFLESLGRSVDLIDQGIKFRAMAAIAIRLGEPLDSPATLDDFLGTARAQEATLDLLEEVSFLDEDELKSLLYIPEVSKAAGKVGGVPSSHDVAVRLLRSQVEQAAEAEADVVIIDGRSIEKYARKFTEEGFARFVMGWYFKCDPAIAARRSLGLFGDIDDLSGEDKLRLLNEAFNISDRNRSDMLRKVDPLHEPVRAFHLDFTEYASAEREFTPYKISHDIMYKSNGGVAVVDTSYTESVDEMTEPVTELSSHALRWHGALSHEDVGIGTIECA